MLDRRCYGGYIKRVIRSGRRPNLSAPPYRLDWIEREECIRHIRRHYTTVIRYFVHTLLYTGRKCMARCSPLSSGRHRRRRFVHSLVSQRIRHMVAPRICTTATLRRYKGGDVVVILIAVCVGIATGIISGFGIGGGSILVLYLTAVLDVSPYTAGGINLLYFIGCAPAALIGHWRQKNVDIRSAIWCTLGGLATAIPVSLAADQLDTDWLRRIFGILLICISIREWRSCRKK